VGERADAVAQARGALELHLVRRDLHLFREPLHHGPALAAQEVLTSSTMASYSGLSMRPTHGAVQRLIWYCRQGRVRVENTPSEQERSGKARCRA